MSRSLDCQQDNKMPYDNACNHMDTIFALDNALIHLLDISSHLLE
jgi:hypothetical protein